MKILILQFSTVNNSLQRHETINLPASSAGRAKAGNQRATPCTVSRGPFRRPQAIGRPTQATAAAGAPDALRRPRSPRPCCGCRSLARSATRQGKNSRYYRTPRWVSLALACAPAARLLPPSRFHATLLWAGGRAPETDADARQVPPLAAFRSLPRLPLLHRGHHKGARARGGAPSIPKSLPPTPIPLLTAGCGGARLRAG